MKRMIERQVNRVWRRLFLATLLTFLAWGWSAALLLSAVWFFVQPYLLAGPPEWLRWAVLGTRESARWRGVRDADDCGHRRRQCGLVILVLAGS